MCMNPPAIWGSQSLHWLLDTDNMAVVNVDETAKMEFSYGQSRMNNCLTADKFASRGMASSRPTSIILTRQVYFSLLKGQVS